MLEFFERMGFKCLERQALADFLQEVTSRKYQQQYWARHEEPYNNPPAGDKDGTVGGEIEVDLCQDGRQRNSEGARFVDVMAWKLNEGGLSAAELQESPSKSPDLWQVRRSRTFSVGRALGPMREASFGERM